MRPPTTFPHRLFLLRPPSPTHARAFSLLNFSKKPASPGSKSSGGAAPPKPAFQTISSLLKHSPRLKPSPAFGAQRGGLAPGSIFSDPSLDEEADAASPGPPVGTLRQAARSLDAHRDSWGWPKRHAARAHRRRGRQTAAEARLRTEKQLVAKSHMFKTSVKKLAPLARQISGKKIADAIVQMRFSPKKAARDVLAHLHAARNEAVVRKGMEVGEMYIQQAWVGRGTYEREYNHRARGRIDIMRLPYTSITVILKEEVTRQRIAKEKEAKKLRKKVWEQLPSRPLIGQQQYYKW